MPQPIDPMTELGRITAAERIQQIADRASLAAQMRQAEVAAEHLVEAETQVQGTLQKGPEVEEDLRRRNPFLGRRKRRGQRGQAEAEHTFYTAEEKKEIAEDPGEHELDVTV